jgi:NADH:ubiquinone oxidoreductase subunit 4 (subunit M)
MAIIYCSFVIIRQVDIKKIIAYSSIIHMNFALLGLFTLMFKQLAVVFF